MSEVKNWHRCEQCVYFHFGANVCFKHTDFFGPWEKWEHTEADLEACSDFEPEKGEQD